MHGAECTFQEITRISAGFNAALQYVYVNLLKSLHTNSRMPKMKTVLEVFNEDYWLKERGRLSNFLPLKKWGRGVRGLI